MGGHGGLNILPQKRWNVYRFDNREKVRRDEEAAAREDQLNREQSNRRDAEIRLDRLRHGRTTIAFAPSSSDDPIASASIAVAAAPTPIAAASVHASPPHPSSPDSRHINLFDGLRGFSSLAGGASDDEGNGSKKEAVEDSRSGKDKKRKREEAPRAVAPEDEVYKLGYGVAGKGVKAPWYLSREGSSLSRGGKEDGVVARGSSVKVDGRSGKKTIEELREERRKRESQEKQREQAVLVSAGKKGGQRDFSRRRFSS